MQTDLEITAKLQIDKDSPLNIDRKALKQKLELKSEVVMTQRSSQQTLDSTVTSVNKIALNFGKKQKKVIVQENGISIEEYKGRCKEAVKRVNKNALNGLQKL